MDAIREQAKNPIVVGVVAFVVGVIFGLVVLGWWLWPVQWTDAASADLVYEEQVGYLRMTIEAFGYTGDTVQAKARYDALGEDAKTALEGIVQDPAGMDAKLLVDFNAAVAVIPTGESSALPEADIPEDVAAIQTEAVVAEDTSATLPADDVSMDTVTTQPMEEPESKSLLKTLWPLLCLVGMILVAGAIALFIIRGRGTVAEEQELVAEPEPAVSHDTPWQEYPTPSVEPPLGQFMASYRLGDDLFDDSFSIDSASGEFLGECGVGISEMIGVGEPKKVTAFEVWLFDKNDIQTVTKVLMSAHAFGEDQLRQQLAAKGEPVLSELNGETVLETQTLKLVARIVDMDYGDGAMPSESYFDRLVLELEVTQKT
ncbi:hypothetical protein ACFLUA_01540 [Chloroflexota bacterium]